MRPSGGIAYSLTGVSTFGTPKGAPQERDLHADLVPLLAALRRLDGDGAAALVLPLSDTVRAALCKEMVRRPTMFDAGAIRAALASTPRPDLVEAMGVYAAAVAWRCYVMRASNV